MKNILKITFLALLGALLIFVAVNWEAAKYGLLQLQGQLHVISNTVPIEEVLDDPAVVENTKIKIRQIQEIKAFAVDKMGLSETGSYNTYYEQNGEPILWVITASPPYELKAKEWHFPIAGTFRYKGYFDRSYIASELEALEKEGYETRVGEVSAWSTLGVLNDPILSEMLTRSEGDLAALIIHEMTHGTVFIKNDLTFNENLADFIGDYGAKWFLKDKYGEQSEAYKAYVSGVEKDEHFLKELSHGVTELDSLYATFTPELGSLQKDSLKAKLINRIMQKATGKDSIDISPYNNAYFVGVGTYRSRQDEFNEMLMKRFGSNFAAFLAYIKENNKNITHLF